MNLYIFWFLLLKARKRALAEKSDIWNDNQCDLHLFLYTVWACFQVVVLKYIWVLYGEAGVWFRKSDAGMKVLLDDGKVFACHETMAETIFHSEAGSSAAIFNAGYNIDSFMVRHNSYPHIWGPLTYRRCLCCMQMNRLQCTCEYGKSCRLWSLLICCHIWPIDHNVSRSCDTYFTIFCVHKT